MLVRGLYKPYEAFSIPKGLSGQRRSILAPNPQLKNLQQLILARLLNRVEMPIHCHGFVPGRSIVTHARMHCQQSELINYDIEKAFPSVARDRVLHNLKRYLGPLIKNHGPRNNRYDRDQLFELLADLTTHNNSLPQGAPTSGMILNLALLDLDQKVIDQIALWQSRGFPKIVYSRYADDLNLSASIDLPGDAHQFLRKTINKSGFRFNGKKIHHADVRRGQTLRICGLQVAGDEIKIPRKSLRRFRAAFYNAFQSDELSLEQRDHLDGILGFVLMVYGEIPATLRDSFDLLTARHSEYYDDKIVRQRSRQVSGYDQD